MSALKSTRRLALLGCLLLAGACAPSVEGPRDPPPPVPERPVYSDTVDGVHSGLTVSVLYVTTPDGAQMPRALYDRAHNQVCEPASDRAGELRCLPTRYAAQYGGWYVDPGCTHPLYIAELACPDHALTGQVYIREFSGACNNRRIFQAIPLSSAAYVFEGGICKAKELPLPPSTHAFYAAGPEIDPAEFPKMAAAIGKRGL